MNEIPKNNNVNIIFQQLNFYDTQIIFKCHTNVMYVEPQNHGQLAMGDIGSH